MSYVPDDPNIITVTEHHQSCAWYSVDNSPPYNGSVWGFCPDIGNDDEGYGMVLVVHYEGYRWTNQGWYDIHGQKVHVTKWAVLYTPEVPSEWIQPTPPEQ